MGDQRLDEAAEVVARRQLLLENKNVDPNWALPQVKVLSRKLNRLTKRIRQPFGAVTSNRDVDEDETADDFAAGPVQALVKRLVKPISAIKVEPLTIKKTPPNKPVRKPRVQHTPVVTPTPRRAKPPPSPVTGVTPFETAAEEDDSPTTFIERRYRQLFTPGGTPRYAPPSSPGINPYRSPPRVQRTSSLPPTPEVLGKALTPTGAARASPQYTLGTPGASYPPWPSGEQVLTAPPLDYPYIVQRSAKRKRPTVVKRKVSPPVRQRPQRKRQKISKKTSAVGAAKQYVSKKAKQKASEEVAKLSSYWLRYK